LPSILIGRNSSVLHSSGTAPVGKGCAVASNSACPDQLLRLAECTGKIGSLGWRVHPASPASAADAPISRRNPRRETSSPGDGGEPGNSRCGEAGTSRCGEPEGTGFSPCVMDSSKGTGFSPYVGDSSKGRALARASGIHRRVRALPGASGIHRRVRALGPYVVPPAEEGALAPEACP